MKKNQIFLLVAGILCLLISIGMWIIGNDSSHLSELKDNWWIPLPLGLLLIVLGVKKR